MDRQGDWAEASGGLDLTLGETPRFSGRALVNLLTQPEVMKERSGTVQVRAYSRKEAIACCHVYSWATQAGVVD